MSFLRSIIMGLLLAGVGLGLGCKQTEETDDSTAGGQARSLTVVLARFELDVAAWDSVRVTGYVLALDGEEHPVPGVGITMTVEQPAAVEWILSMPQPETDESGRAEFAYGATGEGGSFSAEIRAIADGEWGPLLGITSLTVRVVDWSVGYVRVIPEADTMRTALSPPDSVRILIMVMDSFSNPLPEMPVHIDVDPGSMRCESLFSDRVGLLSCEFLPSGYGAQTIHVRSGMHADSTVVVVVPE